MYYKIWRGGYVGGEMKRYIGCSPVLAEKKGIAVTFVRDRNGINNKKRISPQNKKKNRRRWGPWGTAMIGWRGGSHHPSASTLQWRRRNNWLVTYFFLLLLYQAMHTGGSHVSFFPPFSLLDEPRPRAFSRVGGVCPCGRLFSAFLVSFHSKHSCQTDRERKREKEKKHDPFFVRLLPYLVRLHSVDLWPFSLVTWTLDSWTSPPMEYKSDWLNRLSLFNAMGNSLTDMI